MDGKTPRVIILLVLLLGSVGHAQTLPKYELLLRGGHLIDPRNDISAPRDVAIAAGKVAAVAPQLNPAEAAKTIDVSGLYVVPGLVDIHTHVDAGTGEQGSYAGDNSVYPDGFTLRAGVTTIADAGGSGWRNFEDFKQRIIDRSKTRVLAFLNIVGHGMRGGAFEQDLADMGARPTADMAVRYRGLIVGVKTALLGTSRRAGPVRPAERRAVGGPQAWGDLRRRARRRQLRVADRGAGRQGTIPARLDFDRPAHRKHECRDERPAQCHEQVPGAGASTRGRGPSGDLEPRA